LVAAGAGNRV